MNKLKILAVPSDEFGCGLYRMKQPVFAVANCNDDVDILLHMHPEIVDLDGIDLLIIQRVRITKGASGAIDMNMALVKEALRRKIPVVYEHDDNDYAIPKHHGMYAILQADRITDKVDWMLENCDAVTTTTEYLANVFRKRTSDPGKVVVFPNCINPMDKNWKYDKTTSNRVRIGWAGGSSHHHDLMELRGVADELYRKYGDRLLFMIGGYDTRGFYNFYDAAGNPQQRPIEEHESIWVDMAHEFFGNIPRSSRRIMNTLPVDQYGFFFSQFDIGVVPLKNDEFSRAKSPLKLLEFGAYGVPCAFSNVEPYKQVLSDFEWDTVRIPTDLNRTRTQNAWVNALSMLIDNVAYRKEIGNRLHNLIMRQFNEQTWAPERYKFWSCIAHRRPFV